jgi:hypothetical protein
MFAHLENAAQIILAVWSGRGSSRSVAVPLASLVATAEQSGLSREQAWRGVMDALVYGWLDFGPVPGNVTLTETGATAAHSVTTLMIAIEPGRFGVGQLLRTPS